jgi:hypothetical protein
MELPEEDRMKIIMKLDQKNDSNEVFRSSKKKKQKWTIYLYNF